MPVPPCAQGDEGELELTGTESVLEVVLSLANSGGSMTPGSSLHFQALVIEHSWEVWTNYSMGVSEFRGYTTQVMPGQQLNWSMEYGDAGIYTTTNLTDGNGQADAVVIQGTQGSRLRASVSRSDGSESVGSYDLVPDLPQVQTENWWLDRSESLLTVTMSSSDSSFDQNGGRVEISAQVTRATWEVWQSNQGRTETRNYGSVPAVGAEVNFSLQSGEGTLEIASTTTDAGGRVTVQFLANPWPYGTREFRIGASATFEGGEATATHDFARYYPDPSATPQEVWTAHSYWEKDPVVIQVEGGSQVAMSPGQQRTVKVIVTGNQWNFGTSNLGGYYQDTTPSATHQPIPYIG